MPTVSLPKLMSMYDGSFTYRIGKEVTPTLPFDTRLENECASGIHFFKNFDEALNY